MDLSLPLQIFVITEWPGSTCKDPRPLLLARLPPDCAAETLHYTWRSLASSYATIATKPWLTQAAAICDALTL